MGQIASRYVPIFHTLETIERINRHLALHENAQKPDIMAIEQWLRIRADLQRQLHEMLFDLNALPPLAEPIMKAERPVADGTSMRRIIGVEQMAKIRGTRMAKQPEDNIITTESLKSRGKKPADGAPMKRAMSAEHLAKIREARMANRAAANVANTGSLKPRNKKPVDGGAPMKRDMGAEENRAKIREARIKRNTDAGASNAMTPKPKVEKNTPDGGTKKSR